jgi:hypothetical protein
MATVRVASTPTLIEVTTEPSTVALVVPSSAMQLAPDESRKLAIALLEAAQDAETTGQDNWP